MSSQNPQPDLRPDSRPEPIAIIGMGGLFPDAPGLQQFWGLLRTGHDAISTVPPSHWDKDALVRGKGEHIAGKLDYTYSDTGGFLGDLPFDPMEYGIPPTVLEATDTAQLLGLVAGRMALDHAGYTNDREFNRHRTSVILGVTGALELVVPLGARLGHPQWRKAMEEVGIDAEMAQAAAERISDYYVPWQENSFPGLLGNVVAGRIANRLNLRGTNCVVDAACASSLAALHLAVMELRSGHSDMVLCGGVDAFNDIFMFMCFTKTQALSPSGHARPFSPRSDGTVLGEGVGMVVLKRLSDARRDGDPIRAVILGVGTSSDGRSQSIYAPRSEGQAAALRNAYTQAGVSPRDVQLVEAHGTGTKVGDQVEFDALRTVYSEAAPGDVQWCALGSVKSQIGHTKSAAGAASLVKAALALEHKVIPGTLKHDGGNPALELEKSPFRLADKTRPWPATPGQPRRAAVSSFGFGGSNFHTVLEEAAPEKTSTAWDGTVQIAAASGFSRADVLDQLRRLRSDLKADARPEWRAWLLQESRRRFDANAAHRALLTLTKPAEDNAHLQRAIDALSAEHQWPEAEVVPGVWYGTGATPGQLAFVYPGQGSQYPGMGGDWTCVLPELHRWVARFDHELPGLWNLMQGPAVADQEKELSRTDRAQAALGAVSAGLSEVLIERFGLKPDAVAGHSYGELPALLAAGRIGADGFVAATLARGAAMASAARNSTGAMLAVMAPREKVEAALTAAGESVAGVVPANHNAPEQLVLSGPVEAVAAAESALQGAGLTVRRLAVSGAFHSPAMASAAEQFRQAALDALKPSETASIGIRHYRCLNGAVTAESDSIAENLAAQITGPVEWVHTVEAMHEAGVRCFVEVGSKGVLSGLVRRILGGRDHIVVALDPTSGRNDGMADLAAALCHLAALGYGPRLDQFEQPVAQPRKQAMTVNIRGINYRSTPLPPAKRIVRPHAPAAETSATQPATAAAPSNSNNSHSAEQAPQPRSQAQQPFRPSKLATAPMPSIPTASATASPALSPARNPATMHQQPTHQPSIAQPGSGPADAQAPKMPSAPPMPFHGPAIHDQAAALQAGLIAIQSLHERTAQVHSQFLQGVQQSQAALVGLLTGGSVVPAVSGPSLPSNPTPQPVALTAPSFLPAPAAPPPAGPDTGGTTVPLPSSLGPSVSDSATLHAGPRTGGTPVPQFSGETPVPHFDALESTMIAAVAELTGYPADMIELGMDLEGDLGIDSIKRVEILAAVQRQMPGLPAIDSTRLGSLRTLGEIVAAYAEQGGTAAQSGTAVSAVSGPSKEAGTAPQPASPGQANHNHSRTAQHPVPPGSQTITRHAGPNTGETPVPHFDALESTMIAAVAELTGYPADMIELGMDLEGDLGIDSIKRVEILAAVQRQMPGLPAIDSTRLGSLRTLGEIVAAYAEQGGTAVQSGTAVPAVPGPSQEARIAPQPASPSQTNPNHIQASQHPVPPGSQTITHPAGPRTGETPVPLSSPQAPSLLPALLQIVSDLTGYPQDMIDPTMDLEADLGIDSIKRVEILAAAQRIYPALAQLDTAQLNSRSTLKAIVDLAESVAMPPAPSHGPSPAPASTPSIGSTSSTPSTPSPATVERRILSTRPVAVSSTAHFPLPAGSRVSLVSEPGELADALLHILRSEGYTADLTAPGTTDISPETAGIIVLAANLQRHDSRAGWAPEDEQWIERAFATVHAAAPAIAARTAPSLFATITALDGAFGLSPAPKPLWNPAAGALAGLVKTAALEWPACHCAALDVAPELLADTGLLASRILPAITAATAQNLVEVGITPNEFLTVEIAPKQAVRSNHSPHLQTDDLVVVLGGARGVTVDCLEALVREVPVRLLLTGRTSLTEESPTTAGAHDLNALRAAVMKLPRAGKPTPAAIERDVRQILAVREVRATIARLQAAGARHVDYAVLDVADSAAVENFLRMAVEEHGPVRGLVHSAGVIEDKFIAEKSPEQFRRVWGTKVPALRAALNTLDLVALRTVALFSSVSARFGNAGQADYAMANEALNKCAAALSHQIPGCRVVSCNWGPWDGGMVTPELKRAFEARGVSVIPPRAGARAFVDEILATSETAAVEVVLGNGLNQPIQTGHPNLSSTSSTQSTASTQPVPAGPALPAIFTRPVDVHSHPFLNSHVLAGRAVLPLALMAEWMAHAAVSSQPGLHLRELHEIRVLRGLKLNGETVPLSGGCLAGEFRGGTVEAQLDLSSPLGVHARARAILSSQRAADVPFPAGFFHEPGALSTYPLTMEEAYRAHLFHGPDFQGISAITGIGPKGLRANIAAAPAPADWMASPLRGKWLLDPLLVDVVLQAGILFTQHHSGAPCLPSHIARITVCNPMPAPGTACLLELAVTTLEPNRLVADGAILDGPAGRPILALSGIEWTVDAGLKAAFAQNGQAAAGHHH